MIETFEVVARLNQDSTIILLDTDGNVIDYNAKAKNILETVNDKIMLNVDDKDKFKQYLVRCSKNLNLLSGGFSINKKRYYVDGSVFSHRENSEHIMSVILFISDINKFSSSFQSLNKITNLSHKISKHRALEKVLREQAEELKKSEKEIRNLVNLDHLTNLASKAFFGKVVNDTIKNASIEGSKFTLMFCDLDKFKAVNDTLGHDVGDLLLKHIANEIKKILPKGCIASRFGGDEFVILLNNEKVKNINKFIDSLKNIFSAPITINNLSTYTSISIGVAIYPNDGQNYEELAKHADLALYDAKNISGSSYSFFSAELRDQYLRYNKVENNLRQAIKNNDLYINYQPQYDLKTMNICGIEALCRWKDNELGYVSPTEFITIAENSGLIEALTEIVFAKALKEFKDYSRKHTKLFEKIKISLNVSALYMNNAKSFEKLVIQTKESGVPNHQVCFEVTETAIIHYKKTAIELLQWSKDKGYSHAIDDFGVGHSSLSYLKDLPTSVLKIDASFTQDIDKDQRGFIITKAIVNMGKTLGLQVIAEGAETKAQIDLLKEMDCDAVQGFYLAKPMTMLDVIKLLEKE